MLTPIGKRVFVMPIEKKSKGILILSEEPSTYYLVIDIGDEVTKVVKGDVVYLSYVGPKVKDTDYFVVEENTIIGKDVKE